MKRALRIGFLSVALAQSLCAVNAEFWWQLDQANNEVPPGAQNPLGDTLTIWEKSTLNLTSVADPQRDFQWYFGNINLNHDLTINFTTQEGQPGAGNTPIYLQNDARPKVFEGLGKFTLNIHSPNVSARAVFGISRSLLMRTKTHITATENSRVTTIFHVQANSTLETYNDFIVDLSQVQGTFHDNHKSIFDTAGVVNVNPDRESQSIIQLSGDIDSYGGFLTFNLLNNQSFYNGNFVIRGNSRNTINLGNQARTDMHLRIDNASNFTLNLSNDASAKTKTSFNIIEGSNAIFNTNHASLYADFEYLIPDSRYQGRIILNNGGVWYLGQSNTIDYLEVNNDVSKITTENFENLNEMSAVDMRYRNQGRELRNDMQMTSDNRYVLRANQIRGSNGVFRIFGVLNQEGWTLQGNVGEDGFETIATDQIIANQIFSTHYMQVFWNANNLDKSMLNKNLEEHKIVVAKQERLAGGSDFVGAVTPIGLYNYITKIKEDLDPDNNGIENDHFDTHQFRQWIISDVQRADNSYLSRLLDSLFQSQYRVFKMESDTFNQRMGELRDMERVHGVWLRTKYGRFSSKSTSQTTASWDEFTSVWAGYDQNFTVLGGKNFLGFALNTTAFRNHGIAEEDDFSGESYYASSRSYGISIYDTYIFDNGLYIDGLFKYYLTDNRMSIHSEVLANNYPKFFTHGLVGSLEVGKKFRLPIKTPDFANSFYYLRPELQMTLGFVSGTTLNLKDWSNQNIRSQLDFNIPANFRAGLMFGREFNKPYIKGDVYLGTSFEYDVNTGGDLRLEDFLDKMTLTHKGNFTWRLNAGTNLILNEYWRIYFDIDTSFFGQISSTFTLNGGVRINFGQLHPKMPYITPDQEVFDPSVYRKDRRTIPEVQNYETQGILDNLSGKRKKPIYKPPVKIKSRPFGGEKQNTTPPNYNATPQVQQPKGAPVFIDNPSAIQAPEKNYKRDATTPISPNVIPQNQRDMQSIQEGLNQGYRR